MGAAASTTQGIIPSLARRADALARTVEEFYAELPHTEEGRHYVSWTRKPCSGSRRVFEPCRECPPRCSWHCPDCLAPCTSPGTARPLCGITRGDASRDQSRD